jgi:hypothetical protein
MKRHINRAIVALLRSKISKSVGVVLALVLTSLAFANPAQAAYLWSAKFTYAPQGHGGAGLIIPGNPNCYTLATSGTARQIPAVVNFIYCGSITPPGSNSGLIAVLNSYSAGMSNAAANVLVNTAQYQVVYYETLNDWCLTTAYSNNGQTLAQQCAVAVSTIYNQGGRTDYGKQNLTASSVIYQQTASGPGVFAQNTILAHTALHEAGHAFDWARGDTILPLSQQNQLPGGVVAYFGALNIDYIRLGQCPISPLTSIWKTDLAAYGNVYFHCPAPSGQHNDYREIFAEEFAMGASGSLWQNTPIYQSYPTTLDTVGLASLGATQNGTACANLWVWYYMNYLQAPTLTTYAAYYLTGTCTGLPGSGFNYNAGG